MKRYKVTMDVFFGAGEKQVEVIEVIAGTKKLASLRAMQEINKRYQSAWKSVVSIEEVK